jgi:hypothetical protein
MDRRFAEKSRDHGDIRRKVGCIIHEILDISHPKGFPNVLMLIKSMIECLLHKPFWTNLHGIMWNSLTVS